jgi:hypothetical protein
MRVTWARVGPRVYEGHMGNESPRVYEGHMGNDRDARCPHDIKPAKAFRALHEATLVCMPWPRGSSLKL